MDLLEQTFINQKTASTPLYLVKLLNHSMPVDDHQFLKI